MNISQCVHKRLQYLDKITDRKSSSNIIKSSGKKVNLKFKNLKEITNGHVEGVFEFIRNLSSYKEVKEDIEIGEKKYKFFQTISDFLEILKDFLLKDIYFQHSCSETISETMDEIENFIVQKISMR